MMLLVPTCEYALRGLKQVAGRLECKAWGREQRGWHEPAPRWPAQQRHSSLRGYDDERALKALEAGKKGEILQGGWLVLSSTWQINSRDAAAAQKLPKLKLQLLPHKRVWGPSYVQLASCLQWSPAPYEQACAPPSSMGSNFQRN